MFDGRLVTALGAGLGFWRCSGERRGVDWFAGLGSLVADGELSTFVSSAGPVVCTGLSVLPFAGFCAPSPLVGEGTGLFALAFKSSDAVLFTAGLPLRLLSFLSIESGLSWAALSTATKLARTLERGLPEPGGSDPTGDRPRDGGDVAFWLLFSNLAFRLWTDWEPDAIMDIGEKYNSVETTSINGTRKKREMLPDESAARPDVSGGGIDRKLAMGR